MNAVERVTDQDLQIIKECLDAAVNGPFFPDWEFHTLMGFTRDEIGAIAASWPSFSDSDTQDDAVNNVLNMLLGYPHGYESRWHDYSNATLEQIVQTLARWRGDDDLDGTGKGTFERLR
ncbi:hypothetical protein FGW37_26750 [Streptomyces rectiverticillatus]|uniref:hypothetical protein n=1 Tax=Streptomyces rectiverticillatus TaxID=173860 RepID=UPI0015C345EB|nr:hypothetical protein [Streptomyces rectiverticillatus]QLE74706.1 hypothetical protein FGW37_26750 [Streptomyces rectiverticillatus]